MASPRKTLTPEELEERRQIAHRVRARIAELGTSESAIAESWGKDRTVLSTQLGRVEAGGNLRDDTLRKLAVSLGKSIGWILTGVEEPGFRLADQPGWAGAAKEAQERFGFSDEVVKEAGEMRAPLRPGRLDAHTAEGFIRTWMNAK
jgi:hypothetical protein